ncbi:MAG TPA: hypothetical protein VGK74_02505 [Symbiobacteriaceae bacterium]|jgi:hypothetical protein
MPELSEQELDALMAPIRAAVRKAHGETGYGDVTVELRGPQIIPKVEWANRGRESVQSSK